MVRPVRSLPLPPPAFASRAASTPMLARSCLRALAVAGALAGAGCGAIPGSARDVLDHADTFEIYALEPYGAADGEGSNGPYTEELVKAMAVPGLKVEEVFKRVTVEVEKRTGGQQTPWTSSSLTAPGSTPTRTPPAVTRTSTQPCTRSTAPTATSARPQT